MDVLCFHVHLIGPERVHELGRVRPWEQLGRARLDDVDSEAGVLDRSQEGIELEIADVLWTRRHDVRGVQVIPDIVNFADGNPVVSLVRNEPLLVRVVDCLLGRGAYWVRLDLVELEQGPGEDLDGVVAIIGHVGRLPEEV